MVGTVTQWSSCRYLGDIAGAAWAVQLLIIGMYRHWILYVVCVSCRVYVDLCLLQGVPTDRDVSCPMCRGWSVGVNVFDSCAVCLASFLENPVQAIPSHIGGGCNMCTYM